MEGRGDESPPPPLPVFLILPEGVAVTAELVFRIAAIGLLTSLLAQVLKKAGREEIASLASLAGLVIVLLMVVDLIREFLESVRTIFMVY